MPPYRPASSLPHTTFLPHTRETRRLLARLPKPTLLALAARWLAPATAALYGADLTPPDDDDPDADPSTLDAAADAYKDLDKPSVRARAVAERMLEWEWRGGMTLLGVAEVEWECNPSPPPSPLSPDRMTDWGE